MSADGADAESRVSGNQANIPASVRRELDIDDGDHLRWRLEDGGVHVEVVRSSEGTFQGFEGYEGSEDTDVVDDHDDWGVDSS